MKAWVFLCNDSPLEHWMEGYMERFDAWEEGGVTGLVVGRMQFCQTDGTPVRGYAPDPKVYADHGETPPDDGPRDLEKERRLLAMLDDAAGRGWPITIFAGGGTTGHVQALMKAFPQTQGS